MRANILYMSPVEGEAIREKDPWMERKPKRCFP